MKIDGVNGRGGPRVPGRRSGPQEASRGAGRPQGGDRVDLSAEARQAARLADVAGGLPEVRQELVRTLREALAGGTYSVDAQAVARAIVEFENGWRR
ncbi:MAG TPA: flagellar biosynthesis anti-sigma factor FlgM [Candidatus Polarisedimenticolia bacterium]|nr:flagellar biosynthesis anti-sigma factor FlgM [Candidatus Polarisedimenticolia bacterium]